MSGRGVCRRLVPALLLASLALAAAPAASQTSLRGDIGADLSLVDFQNDIETLPDPYAVRRAISDQFMSLLLKGPLWDASLGNYSLRTRFAGQFYSVGATSGSGSEYTTPRLTGINTSIGLFPGRRYPLRLFYLNSILTALNYEQENRSVDDQQSPELAAVRRYDATNEAFGGDWRYGISPTSDVVLEGRRTDSTSQRQYDFAEQRDIWVEFLTPSPDPTLPVVRIIVQNGVPEGDVILLVDGIAVATLLPEERFEFQLESGPHNVEFVPSNFNSFAAVVDVNGDMFWKTYYNEPPGRNDVRRAESSGRAEWTSGRDQRLENTARVIWSDSFDEVIGRDAMVVDMENALGYDWTPQTRLRSTTSWTLTQSEMAGSSSQDNRNLRQQTRLGYRSFEGSLAGVEHLYDRTNSVTGGNQIVTTQNRVRAEVGRELGPLQHRMTLRDMLTHLTNSEATRTFENRFEVQNDASIYTGKFRWRPRSVIGFANSSRKNPDSGFREFEIRELLEADRPRLWVLGDLIGVLEFGWRRRAEDAKTDETIRYNGALSVTRNLGPKYQLFVSANSNNETYNTELRVSDAAPTEQRDPQRQRSFRGTLRANPLSSVTMNAGYSHTTQVSQVQTELRFDVTVRLPYVGIPITSSLSEQSRQIVGRRDQSTRRWETRTSFSIRRIRVQIEHSYVAETLFTEDYSLHLFRAEISRAFSVF